MAHRHTPRQSELDREHVRHDPHARHHLSQHPPPPPPPLNGAGPPPGPPLPLNGGPPPPHHSPNVGPAPGQQQLPNGAPLPPTLAKLATANEETWLLIGRVAEQMGDLEHALSAYENALRHNPNSLSGLTQVAGIARIKENFPKAVDYFQRALALQQENGEVWSALGHCYLMQDELQKAYAAYQQALYLLPNPKEDPRLWYGIGILYDRYGSLDHAEEAFSSVLRMDKSVFTPDFDKANEILFRLGIIYKQQGKYQQSLDCFDRILRNPPSPLAHADIWFQIGHVYEQQKDLVRAKDAYERVVEENPNHSKVLQQLGWIYHQDGSTFQNQDAAIAYLTKSLEADPTDAQSWYLLGRAYMAGQKYNKAYEAYQQAVYRDGRNPTFWCSIGVLYFQINQYRDALDAYSRAIRINPYISEVWFDLGSLYESCNNQITDAIDAYMRAAELDPHNTAITQRLQLLKQAQATGGALPAAPGPTDVHPTAYANSMVGPQGPPIHFQTGPRPPPGPDGRPAELSLQPPPPPPQRVGSPPYGGRGPPPLVLDESRQQLGHTPFAPMEVDRPPPGSRGAYPPPSRDAPPSRGPGGPSSVLLHHPVPQPQVHPEDLRNGQSHPNDPYAGRGARRLSTSTPPPHSGRRSPSASYPPYSRGPVGPGQANGAPPMQQHSPHTYSYDPAHAQEHDRNFERRARADAGWEREQRERRTGRPTEYPASAQSVYPPRQPSPTQSHHSQHRARSPRRRDLSPVSPNSPRANGTRGFWDARNGGGPHHAPPPRAPSPQPPASYPGEPAGRARYDPRFDGRTTPMEPPRTYASSPEAMRNNMPPPPDRSVSPSGSSVTEGRGGARRPRKDAPSSRRDKREPAKRVKEEPVSALDRTASARVTPGPSSSGSIEPSPTSAGPQVPRRSIDENYDEGIADVLVALSGSGAPSERPGHAHRNSVSSTLGRPSPPPPLTGPPSSSSGASLKRPGSPRAEEPTESKRSRLENPRRRSSESNGLTTPLPSSRPSPIPFRTQPGAANPLSPAGAEGGAPPVPPPSRRLTDGNGLSPRLPAVLPPHPRPHGGATHHMALPPIATLPQASSPRSSSGAASPASEDRMQVDAAAAARRSPQSPQARGHKITDMLHHASPPLARPPTAPGVTSPGARSASVAGEKADA